MKDEMALIRKCDKCGMITAIDLDVTLKHKREMQMVRQTVHEVTKEEALKLWKNAGACVHPCTKTCGDCAHWRVTAKHCLDAGGDLSGDPACKNFKEKAR